MGSWGSRHGGRPTLRRRGRMSWGELWPPGRTGVSMHVVGGMGAVISGVAWVPWDLLIAVGGRLLEVD